MLGQAWSECVDSQRAGGQDFTEECAERTGALQARALAPASATNLRGRCSLQANCSDQVLQDIDFVTCAFSLASCLIITPYVILALSSFEAQGGTLALRVPHRSTPSVQACMEAHRDYYADFLFDSEAAARAATAALAATDATENGSAANGGAAPSADTNGAAINGASGAGAGENGAGGGGADSNSNGKDEEDGVS